MRILGRLLLVLLAVLVLLFLFGPREPIDGSRNFDAAQIGEDLEAYLAASEAEIPNIIPGAQKQIIWADPETRAQTDIAVVYIHGFSATLEEIRPVPDQVAANLGANLYYTRLTGHGRDGEAMAEATVADWRDDFSEAMEIGRRLGERVIVMGTSTGGTIAALGAFEEGDNADLAGVIFVSPNFELAPAGSELLTLPLVRYWGPVLVGETRSFEPINAEHGEWWTTQYPTTALLPMAASVMAASDLNFESATVPALFVFSDQDQVVKATATRTIADRWGAPAQIEPLTMGDGDDPFSHVVSGDILSPGQTPGTVARMTAWIEAL